VNLESAIRPMPPRAPSEPSFGTVAHVTPQYLPRASTYIYTQLRFQRRFDPLVLTQETANLSEFPLEHPVLVVTPEAGAPRRAGRRARAALAGYATTHEYALAREIRRHECVLIHAHAGWSGRPSVTPSARLDLPLVTSFYGRDLAEKRRRRALRPPYERLFDQGALFLCEGPASAAHVERLGCPAEKIRVVRIGIDLDRFPFVPRARSRPLVIMQVARFWEKKGVDLSIKSFAAARERLGPSELWLVGDGPLRSQLERLAARLGVAESVRFVGELSHQEYRDLTARAHVCIQPSRTASDGDTEGGAPTVLLEMQAVGIPIVATRHADIPFVVADERYLAEEEDVEGLAAALVRLAEASVADYEEHALRGRSYVETEHDAQVVARVIEDCYLDAIRRTGGEVRIRDRKPDADA
jgi:colanic acid/amylovoran biosynthesis glycosyltransferase